MNKRLIIIIIAVVLVCFCVGVVFAIAMFSISKENKTYGSLSEACHGNPVPDAASYSDTSGIHPAVGMKLYGSKYSAYNYAIPDQALAEGVSDAQLVLCLKEAEKELLERCPYGKEGDDEATNVVERYSYELDVILVEAKTGNVLAEDTLVGDEPRECLDEEVFPSGQDTISVEGEEVSSSQLQEWLRPYVIIP